MYIHIMERSVQPVTEEQEVADLLSEAQWIAVVAQDNPEMGAALYNDLRRAAMANDEAAAAVLKHDVIVLDTSPGKTHPAAWFLNMLD